MNRKVLCLIVVLTCVTLCLTACGAPTTPSAPAPAAPASSSAAQPTSAPAAPQAMTPKELGDKIGAVYVGSLEAATKLLENKPDAATALPQVTALKEQTIQQLVELGKQREALSTAERASVDNAINSALTAIASAAVVQDLQRSLAVLLRQESRPAKSAGQFQHYRTVRQLRSVETTGTGGGPTVGHQVGRLVRTDCAARVRKTLTAQSLRKRLLPIVGAITSLLRHGCDDRVRFG